MKSNLQKTTWAHVQKNVLIPIAGELPTKMSSSDATALPLVKDGLFGADIIRFKPQESVSLHTHVGAHILLVTKGEGILTYENEEYDLKPGEIYLVPENVPHAIDAKTELVLIAIGNNHQDADSSKRLDVMPKIHTHNGFHVLRDDLSKGGTKKRALDKIISNIKEEEIACAVHSLGYSQLALALSAQEAGKTVTLFYAEEPNDIDIFQETQSCPNITSRFYPDIKSQQKLQEVISQYCKESGAYHMPVGFDTEEFSQEVIKTALSLPIQPKEVWLLSGSGTLARALHRAWPHAQFNIVNMGFTKPTIPARVFNVRENTEEEAYDKPPYPSANYYDAKLWHFAKKHASPGALVWNVAGDM